MIYPSLLNLLAKIYGQVESFLIGIYQMIPAIIDLEISLVLP
jgi:hypothetical protein